MRGRQREQLQPGDGPGGEGRMQKRHGGSEAEIPVQLPLQEGHEEGEKLPAHLLEHVPNLTGYVAKHRHAPLPPSAACSHGPSQPHSVSLQRGAGLAAPLVLFSCAARTSPLTQDQLLLLGNFQSGFPPGDTADLCEA